MKTTDGVQVNIERLALLFPECITEKVNEDREIIKVVDFEKLRLILSNDIVDESEERYQFTWPDKKSAILLSNSPINSTLRPCREGSVDFENTKNLYIEGDNLDVLKCLREAYLGKVNVIYIDPPYNTGKDFIYQDNFVKNTSTYLSKSGQYDSEGNRLVVNQESNGRFHTDWLNMIYPRLRVAKDLLSTDGVIFISLDDVEVFNLKKVADEIFGQENFVCNFIRKNKSGSGHDSKSIAVEFDYILCYAKDIKSCQINQKVIDIENDSKYNQADEFVDRRGKYYLRDLDYKGTYSESGDYPIMAPDNTEIYPGGFFGKPNTWRWSKEKVEWGLKNGFIVFKQKGDKWKVYIKQYQFVDNSDCLYNRTIPYRALIDYSNGLGTTECTDLLGSGVFSFPKPSELIKHLLKIGSQKDALVLDFFSGSASTAHAVMKLNMDDKGERRFIMVQIPEKTSSDSEAYRHGYKTICDIGRARIQEAAKRLVAVDSERAGSIDLGFRLLRLDSSNMRDVYYSPDKYKQEDLFSLVDNVKEDRTPEDLLFQVMVELGATLDSKIEQIKIRRNTIFNVEDGYLLACFDEQIDDEVVTSIAQKRPIYAVFKDASMQDDNTATNFEQIFKTYSPETIAKVL